MQIPLLILFCLNAASGLIMFLASLLLERGDFYLPALIHTGLAGMLLFPCFTRTHVRLMDPFNFALLYILIGGLAPAYFIAFNQTPRIQYLMANQDLASFQVGSLWYAISLVLIGLGYVSCRKRLPVERLLPSEHRLGAAGFQFALIVGMILSVFAILSYVQSTGGIGASLADISRKRSIEVVSHGEVVHATGAYLRMLSDISTILLLVVMSFYLARFKRLPFYISVQIWILAILSLLVPFMASSRSSVIFVGLAILITLDARDRLSGKVLIVTTVIGMTFFAAMTSLRSAAQQDTNEGGIENPFLAMAESGNGLSLFGTTHIIQGVPERMSYQLGTTYLTWLVAPIPRTLWPQKPDVSLGKRIKEKIMQQRVIRSGRPPSIINEGWINFGFLGFLFNAFVFGYALRLIGNSLYPVINNNTLAVPLLYTLTMNTAALTNSALSQGIVRILTDAVLIGIVFILIRYSFAKRTSEIPT